MKEEKNIEQELHELSPLLAKMKKDYRETGFSVPPNYFKDLTTEVMEREQRIADNGWQVTSTTTWWEQFCSYLNLWWQPRLAVAFTIISLLVVGTWIYIGENKHAIVESEELSLEELENYVVTNLDDFGEDLLVEFQTEPPVLDLEIDEENIEELLDDLDIKDIL